MGPRCHAPMKSKMSYTYAVSARDKECFYVPLRTQWNRVARYTQPNCSLHFAAVCRRNVITHTMCKAYVWRLKRSRQRRPSPTDWRTHLRLRTGIKSRGCALFGRRDLNIWNKLCYRRENYIILRHCECAPESTSATVDMDTDRVLCSRTHVATKLHTFVIVYQIYFRSCD
jgi:hypothetical protein